MLRLPPDSHPVRPFCEVSHQRVHGFSAPPIPGKCRKAHDPVTASPRLGRGTMLPATSIQTTLSPDCDIKTWKRKDGQIPSFSPFLPPNLVSNALDPVFNALDPRSFLPPYLGRAFRWFYPQRRWDELGGEPLFYREESSFITPSHPPGFHPVVKRGFYCVIRKRCGTLRNPEPTPSPTPRACGRNKTHLQAPPWKARSAQ